MKLDAQIASLELDHADFDPLTRPAPAGENAGCVPPSSPKGASGSVFNSRSPNESYIASPCLPPNGLSARFNSRRSESKLGSTCNRWLFSWSSER